MITSARCTVRNHKGCLGLTERTAVEPFHPCECACHSTPATPDTSWDSGEPRWPGQLATPAELCAYWHSMDAHYSTPEDSPLHHSNRCEACR